MPAGDTDNPPWPDRSWKMKLFGVDDCDYSSGGKGPGELKCPGMKDPVKCEEDPDKDVKKCIGLWADYYRPVARCFW